MTTFVDRDGTARLAGDILMGGTAGDVATVQADGTLAPAAPSGGAPVSCVLACETDFDVKLVGGHDILWDALYDNLWDLNVLASIPAGLGLTFAFDGSSSLVVPTEAGIWALSYAGDRVGDTALTCYVNVGGIGVSWAWVEQASGAPWMATSMTQPLPAGTQLTHQVITDTQGTATPSNVRQVLLSIVRLG